MKLPESLTTVTKFSKILALLLFITLPFFWFLLGLIIGVRQGGMEKSCPSADVRTTDLYFPDQLKTTHTYDGHDYAEVWRANMNIPIRNSTSYAGIVRKTIESTQWQEYIKIVSTPDQSKNNPYKFWVGDSFYLLLVDQNGGGSGEGVAKLVGINVENDTYEQLKCFYYVPETHKNLDVGSLMAAEDSDSTNCDNYTLEFK